MEGPGAAVTRHLDIRARQGLQQKYTRGGALGRTSRGPPYKQRWVGRWAAFRRRTSWPGLDYLGRLSALSYTPLVARSGRFGLARRRSVVGLIDGEPVVNSITLLRTKGLMVLNFRVCYMIE